MSFTYNLATDIGKVRFLIPDATDAGHLFEDEEIQVALDMESDSIRRATADILDILATNSAKLAIAVTVLDVQIDASKGAAMLQARAKALRAADDDDGSFAIAEMINDPFGIRERIYKEFEREEI